MSKRNALLVVHPTRAEASSAAAEFATALSKKSFTVFANQTIPQTTSFNDEKVEVVVVLGGDGTILRAAELTDRKSTRLNSSHRT